jgi:hypothetical protein
MSEYRFAGQFYEAKSSRLEGKKLPVSQDIRSATRSASSLPQLLVHPLLIDKS